MKRENPSIHPTYACTCSHRVTGRQAKRGHENENLLTYKNIEKQRTYSILFVLSACSLHFQHAELRLFALIRPTISRNMEWTKLITIKTEDTKKIPTSKFCKGEHEIDTAFCSKDQREQNEKRETRLKYSETDARTANYNR